MTLHVTIWNDGPPRSTALLVHGTFTWGTRSFAPQRPLAERYRLLVPDRRGFGASPDLESGEYSSDYEVDAADVVDLLGEGAHLVGHSYGGVVAMLAAAACPEKIRSLTLIEPSALQAATEHPEVTEWVAAARVFMAEARTKPAAEYLKLNFEDIGRPRPQPDAYLERAAASALHERPSWLAEVPLEPLTAGTYPKLVIAGAWDLAEYEPGSGAQLRLTARAVARKIGAEHREIAGAGHDVHHDQPETVNQLLDELWRTG